MKTILYNPIFINPQAYYVFPRLTRYLQPDNESTAEPANYIGTIEVKVIAYGDTTLKRTYTNTDSIDLSEFKNTWIRISLFTKVGSCVLGEWKIGNMESDLPYIDPEVLASLKAVVIVGNKTNNDSDRAIVKNLVDPDNPFVISNAAFKLNSGFGKYEVDFTVYNNQNVLVSPNKIVSIAGRAFISLLPYTELSKTISSYKIKVTGLIGEFSYWYRNQDGSESRIIITKDGIYQLPTCYNVENGQGSSVGFNGYSESSCTIEQIPSFEGAFVTDGIDDLITSTKTVQEMLGGSNEITVVSMAHFIKGESNAPEICRINQIRRDTRSIRNSISKIGKSGIFGYTYKNGVTTINNILGGKNDCTAEGNLDGIVAPFSVEGYYYNNNSNPLELCSIAWYWTIIANKVLITDQINQVIAYFNLDRTLKPDILCNTIKQGITNENHAEFGDKLIDFSGNGRDIQLNNIAWNKESGIDDDGALCLDGVNDFGKVTGMPIYKDYTVVADYIRTSAKENAQDSPILSKSQVVYNSAFLFNYLNINSVLNSYSFGINNELGSISDSERKIYYQSKYVNDGKSINSGTGIDYNSMWLGTYRDNVQIFFNGAIYSLMSFPYSMSKFLIERQLKKYKLGTLYPDMVEFRPVIKANNDYEIVYTAIIKPNNWQEISVGDYVTVGESVAIQIKLNLPLEVTNVSSNSLADVSFYKEETGDNVYTIYGRLLDGKSPQKINITIDEYIRYEDAE